MAVYPSNPQCPRCQQPLVVGAMTCANCGLAFPGGVPSPIPPYVPPPPYAPAPSFEGISSYPPGSPPGTYYGGGEAISNASTVSSPLYPQTPPAPASPWGYQAPPGASAALSAGPATTGASAYPSGPPLLMGTTTPSGPTLSPAPKKPISKVKLFSLIVALLVIVGGGAGAAAYLLTRPKPVISIISDYKVGSTPAGANGTVFHLTGDKFSGSSTITFLLDGQPSPGAQLAESDADGNVKVDLNVTADWSLGQHTITAKDAQDYSTKSGVLVVIVAPGEANTSGPNGAPPDSASFSLNVTVKAQNAATGQQLNPFQETLAVTGQPDPNGGTICGPLDDGQPHSITDRTSNGTPYRETFILACSGSYKGGMISYTETASSFKIAFQDGSGITCTATTPFTFQKLAGSFSNATSSSGQYSADAINFTCTAPNGQQAAFQFDPQSGTWTATK